MIQQDVMTRQRRILRQTRRRIQANDGKTYSERGAIGNANGKVGKDGDEAVEAGALKGQVVRDLVDGEEEVLVGGRTKDVGNGPELPRPERCRMEEASEDDLEGYDAEDDPFGQWLRATELGDLLRRGEKRQRGLYLRVSIGECGAWKQTSGWALMMARRRVRWGSSV